MSTLVTSSTDKYITMHSAAVGEFRRALDALHARLQRPRSVHEARALALLAIFAARAWDGGREGHDRDDIARDIDTGLAAIVVACDYALALVRRLSAARLQHLVAVVAGAEETARAHQCLMAQEIDGYVAYADTDAGVVVDRLCRDEDLCALLDEMIAAVAADTGTKPIDLPVGAKA